MEQVTCDIAIIGGGLVGGTLAAALSHGGFKVAVLDREAALEQTLPAYDGRAAAIALGSVRVLDAIGLWAGMSDHAEPIWDIRVADGHIIDGVSPLFLHYDHSDIGEDPFGYILENRWTRRAISDRLARDPKIQAFNSYTVASIDRRLGTISVQATPAVNASQQEAGVSPDTNHIQIEARLLIAADGKFSKTRDWAGIKTTGWSYDQTSLVCTVRHEKPHHGTAVELFLPGGPFAMLPMTENRSNVIWSEGSALARSIARLDDDAFLSEVVSRFGDWLGPASLEGPRFSYPLSLSHAETYIGERFALIGDAAHAIHPIAGQGLNMGIRDIAALVEVLVDAHRLGLDLGAQPVLERYEQWRRFDNVLLASVTDALTRLFSNDVEPLRMVRDLGLAAVNRVPPVKKLFMRHAMGIVGDLPKLIRGAPL